MNFTLPLNLIKIKCQIYVWTPEETCIHATFTSWSAKTGKLRFDWSRQRSPERPTQYNLVRCSYVEINIGILIRLLFPGTYSHTCLLILFFRINIFNKQRAIKQFINNYFIYMYTIIYFMWEIILQTLHVFVLMSTSVG